MSVTNCRVCGQKFFDEALLQFKNMPKSAQYFPDSHLLNEDNGVDLDVFQCSGCGLIQLSNYPVPYYKEVIRAAGISAEMSEFRKNQFKEFVDKYSLWNKRVIEIGSGKGEFLSIMKTFVEDTSGIEYSNESVEHCKSLGLNVSEEYIDNCNIQLSNSPFDAFFILNFLEHMPEPNVVLSGIYNNLTDDGVGLVEVPNFDMIISCNLFSEFINDHLFYFTKDSLTSLLNLNGFEIISLNIVWHGYIISAEVRKRKQIDLSSFYKSQLSLTNELSEYIYRFESGKIAVWGAGHQALAVLSLTGISEKIKYVIDSAQFKQNKYTPATHLPVYAPDILQSDPVDAVIIMAASYSDEVARIIRQQFNNNIQISILRDYGLEIL
ncbi:MAG: class I SAM-dependent methyltransferase [Bacteroidetes bacterium]|nr:class I SAM-dependent methyltransferase [Bacteroidota bacterium]